MTKELATFFDPFTEINKFKKDELDSQPRSKKGVIDVK